MSLHKLSAGDGYTYLTKQVAALDATGLGRTGLADYYTEKGESPGAWMGSGLVDVDGVTAGEQVSEAQMRALFGEGRHPNADAIEADVIRTGGSVDEALAASRLGRRFPEFDASNGFRTACAEAFGEANAAAGLPRDWPLPADERATIRTRIGTEMFTEQYQRPPADARELAGFIARAGRPATTAVAGYDLTFSPVKSVSTLWAVAPRDVAEQIEQAHDAAVADTVAWIEAQASYTRVGAGGVRQVDVRGLLATAFTHRDARSGDPDLHTHVAISNKVRSADGKWLALDGRVLHKATVAASERYNTRLEAEVKARLGVQFAERPAADARKRPVREIEGVDERLTARWSSRRAAIDVRRGELTARFQADQGRPPTPVEAIKLAQQATLETRQAKHEPRSFAEQRATWRSEALDVLGGETGLARLLERVQQPGTAVAGAPARVDEQWVTRGAAAVVAVVEQSRATWQTWHLRAEAERYVRAANLAPGDVDRAVDAVVVAAVSAEHSVPLGAVDPVAEPAALRRSDGRSVYTVAGSRLLTSAAILAAEQQLVGHAQTFGRRRVEDTAVDLALVESAANGVELNPAQALMVRELATSGACLQLAIAPAGSGKTTAMRVLAAAWADGGGHVLGLAPTAVAAAGLGEQIRSRADTLAKLAHSITTGSLPPWASDIDHRTLLIIDEAGMAGTVDLAKVVDFAVTRGASVRLVGDDQQLASVAAGGVLRDIAESAGASTLRELVRFSDPAEGAATLGLRAGDNKALGFYLDNDRVRVGDESTMTDDAYRAWAGDRAEGVDAVMLAPTRDMVSALNLRARTDRLQAAGADGTGPERTLSDGNQVSAGDVVISRANDRRLPISSSDWVKNGDRWTVQEVRPSGDLQVRHLLTGRSITMPSQYAAEHVELGYASTVHGAQGVTADRCHVIATGQESRQLLYVAMTRGRDLNRVYLSIVGDGDPHSIIRPETVSPVTPTEILTAVLARDQAQQSATTADTELSTPAAQLTQATARYRDALGFAAEQVLGAEALAAIDATADDVRAGLTESPAYGTLRAHLATLHLSGVDPHAALRAAADGRDLSTAVDPAAVLDWRLDSTGAHSTQAGPLPWVPGVPAQLAQHPQWGRYLQARVDLVVDLAADVDAGARGWTPQTAPDWAGRLIEPEHQALRGSVAVWRAATGVLDADARPTGAKAPAAAAARHQAGLEQQVATATGQGAPAAQVWAARATAINPRLVQDPHWPDIADRLASLERAGVDAAALMTTAAAQKDLPDDLPASALWWRIARHVDPAVLDAHDGGPAARPQLRPPWAPALVDVLGAVRAERVMLDPAWPALVTAVTRATTRGWRPAQVLGAAADRTHPDVHPDDGGVRAEDLARALTRHVTLLSAAPDTDPLTQPPAGDDGVLTDRDSDRSAPPGDDEVLPPDPTVDDGSAIEGDALDAGDVGELLEHVDVAQSGALDAAPAREQPLPDAELASPSIAELAVRLRDAEVDRAVVDELFPHRAPAAVGDSAGITALVGGADASVTRDRVLELNREAAAFFQAQAAGSWVPAYLSDRLGASAGADQRFAVGYAPAGWTRLVDHLRTVQSASDDELVAAGLARRASSGQVIDAFRDRLILPLREGDAVVGFVARRNPTAADTGNAGPKYLNTVRTTTYEKGRHLYGLAEAVPVLGGAAATAVLVEGPLDAWAVTASGAGRYVGVATLGTALTDAQADLLLPSIGAGKPGVIVATDPDAAGIKAAERAYWALAARREDPRHLALPAGVDPADYLRQRGPAALREALEDAGPLSRFLIDRFNYTDEATVEERVWALRRCAPIVAAAPVDQWPAGIQRLVDRLAVSPATATAETISAAGDWTTHLRHASGRLLPVRDGDGDGGGRPAAAEQRRLRTRSSAQRLADRLDGPLMTDADDRPRRSGAPAAAPELRPSPPEAEAITRAGHPAAEADPPLRARRADQDSAAQRIATRLDADLAPGRPARAGHRPGAAAADADQAGSPAAPSPATPAATAPQAPSRGKPRRRPTLADRLDETDPELGRGRRSPSADDPNPRRPRPVPGRRPGPDVPL